MRSNISLTSSFVLSCRSSSTRYRVIIHLKYIYDTFEFTAFGKKKQYFQAHQNAAARTLALADMRDPIDNRPYLAEFFSAKDLTNSKIFANLVVEWESVSAYEPSF
jgi:hypothetical protein